jgi:hypothetical protein
LKDIRCGKRSAIEREQEAMLYQKSVDRDEERILRNRPEKKRLGNHFLTAECFGYSPKHRLERWCLPLFVPRDRTETVEQIRYSLSQFNAYTKWLTDGERDAAWTKLTAAARKHGISVPANKVAMPPRVVTAAASATHRMTVTW